MRVSSYLEAWRSHRRGGASKPGGRTRGGLSLQARITLSVAVATAVMLVAFGYIADWAITESTNTMLRDRQQMAEVVAARISESLSGYRHELENLGREYSRTSPPQRTAMLREAGESGRFSGLALLASGGASAWASPPSLARDVSLHSATLLAAAPNNAVVVPPVAGLPGAHPVAFVLPLPPMPPIPPVRGAGGGQAAGRQGAGLFLVGAVDLARAGLLRGLHRDGGAGLDIEVVDDRGMVLMSSDPTENGRITEHMPVLGALLGQGHAGIRLHNVASHPHYVAYAPLPGYPGWGVNVEAPRDFVLSLPHALQRRMELFGGIVVVGMSLLAFLDVRGVVRPLSRLRDAAEKIAGGTLDHPVQVDRRDEVGALARSFETMRTTLKTSREEIAAWNRELEDRVADRTRELTATVAENARLFALARREERNLASTVDLLSDGLLTFDLDRRILSLNPAAERLLGWTSAEAQGLLCTELFACPGCLGYPEATCPIGVPLETGGAARGVRVQARRRSGEMFPALLTTGVGRDEADHPTHFIVTLSDMTTEEAYERQLQGRIRQLTILNELARGLSLLPLRTVEETAHEVVQRIAEVIGSGCRLDLDAYAPRALQATAQAPGAGGDPRNARTSADAGGAPQGLVAAPLVLKGRRIGTLWLDPGAAELNGVDPTLEIIASQVAVAIENAGLYEEVQNRNALRRQLLQRIVVAQEEERHRIARELHDEIGQALTALVMQLGAAERALPPGSSRLRRQLAGIRSLTSQTVGEVRRLMLDLRPAALDDLGLVPAIRWYVESHTPSAGIAATISVSGLDERQRLPRRVELVAFRLIQEAVTNVLRHARAAHLAIALERQEDTLRISVTDDGGGFDIEARRRLGLRGGWGLVGMQERVSLLGGSLTVTSGAGRGTQVIATIPAKEDPDGD